jgi:hypothetical protein
MEFGFHLDYFVLSSAVFSLNEDEAEYKKLKIDQETHKVGS